MTQTAWYEQWFGEEYLQLYPHRDQGEARRAVALVLGVIDVGSEGFGPALDLACGAGRHLKELRRRRIAAVGLDLSFPLLQRAREAELHVVRGDMRDLPFQAGAFSLVTNFFTSFGYFTDPEDDINVLQEVRRTLRPGGWFAFDFLNDEHVRNHLREFDERQAGGMRVMQRRSLVEDGRVIEKRIEIHDPSDRRPRVFYERVRLYSPEELRDLLSAEELIPLHTFGDYEGSPLLPGAPRTILIGRSR